MLKIKVNPFDMKLVKDIFSFLTVASVLLSFILIVVDVPDKAKKPMSIAFIIVLILFYLLIWLRANFATKTKLTINNSTLIIKRGDIFEEEELKVIGFNEYFDTKVDNVVVSDRTLNGMYLNDHVQDVDELDRQIDSSETLKASLLSINEDRRVGKCKKYKLGSIFVNEDYLLTAFSKFDETNRAYLSMNDYIDFLLNLWNEIDCVYNGRSVSIPLFGSGITRFKGYDMVSDQELVELLIWSFRVSRIKFTYPSKVTIIIHKSKEDKINFHKLKGC